MVGGGALSEGFLVRIKSEEREGEREREGETGTWRLPVRANLVWFVCYRREDGWSDPNSRQVR